MFSSSSVGPEIPAMLIVAALIVTTLPIYYTWYGMLNERFFISTFQPAKGLRMSPFLLMIVILAICSLLFFPNLALATCGLGIVLFLIMKFSRRSKALKDIPNYFIRRFPIEFLGIFLFLNIIMFLSDNIPQYF